MLSSLGLDAATEAVYRALLSRPVTGVAGLAEGLNVTDAQVHGALDRLSRLHLVRPSAEVPGRFHPVSPDVGLEVLLARQKANLAARQQRFETARAAAAQLIAEHVALRPLAWPGVELVEGLDQIRDRLTQLTRHVRGEVMALVPDGGHLTNNVDAAEPVNPEVLRRGVRMRTIYLDSARNSPHTLSRVSRLTEQGGEVRTTPALPTRMIIVDRERAVIPVDSDSPDAGAIVLTTSGVLTALCALFESLWQQAKPLGARAEHSPGTLTDTEAAALKLLAEGYTDEAIAKHLGVSPRTARRIATGLMQRLDARSRFEAGVRAAQRNWLA